MLKISVLFLVYFFVNVRGLDTRIAGGSDANISEYPYLAALLSNGGSGAFVQACGGTILTASAILSAASCFYTGTVVNQVAWWRARVGSNNANSGGTIYIVNRITIHNDFVLGTKANDIAVLRTNVAITFQSNVQAARIAGAAYPYSPAQEVYVAGWGATTSIPATTTAPVTESPRPEHLQVAQVWLIDQQLCTSRLSGVGFTVTPSMVCAGFQDVGGRGQCAGDVGGPLLDRDGVVIGVFSHALGCADLYYPDVNTRVASHTRWIVTAATAA